MIARATHRLAWLAAAAAAAAALLLAGCEREARRFTTTPPQQVASVARLGSLQPAAGQQGDIKLAAVQGQGPYDGNAFGVNQGKRLFRWYNCSGCHALNGGGAIGPSLIDDQWKYGAAPENIYASIVQGRPEGMPSFGGHIPEDQVWQLVAYVRSMGGQLRKDVEPSRSDTISGGEAENARTPQTPRPADAPPKPAMGASQ